MKNNPVTVFDLMVPGITAALTGLLFWHGGALVRAALWPGLTPYRWLLVLGEVAFVVMLCWLWRHTARLLLFAREQRRLSWERDNSAP